LGLNLLVLNVVACVVDVINLVPDGGPDLVDGWLRDRAEVETRRLGWQKMIMA